MLLILYPFSDVVISYNYSPVLIIILWFKTAQELTITSEIRYGQSMMQKWLCKGEMQGGEGEKKLKENAPVHVVRSYLSPPGAAASQCLA